MNVQRDSTSAAFDDPLASVRMEAIADLAFGSFTIDLAHADGGHLAMLSKDALELDLSDPLQRQFGDYELLERIGEGGMGVVYRARQRGLDREVAVKLLAAGPWSSKDFIQRFRLEAQNAARMQHPNIVAIYEVGSAEELHFFSMRLVRGGSLATLLRRERKIPARQAAALARTIAEAVDYAHRLGVLHLDLKPANVLIDDDGVPHVADFGLARRVDHSLIDDNDEVSGTPNYMAPEQAQRQKITAATDIWGVGAILYELVTGQPPFIGDSPQVTLKLVASGVLREPRQIEPGLPRDLESIILKCLSHDSASRYASARALADDLGRFLDNRSVLARPLNRPQRLVRWVRREPHLAAATLFALAALVVGLLVSVSQWRAANVSASRAQQTLWQSRSNDVRRGITDGDAYSALNQSARNLREMEAAGRADLAETERLRIGTVLANAPVLVDEIDVARDLGTIAISPDHKTIAAATFDVGKYGALGVSLIDVTTGLERAHLATRDHSFGLARYLDLNNAGVSRLLFSPDSARLVVEQTTGIFTTQASLLRPNLLDRVLVDTQDGTVVAPPAVFKDFLSSVYSDDGRFALLVNRGGRVQRWRTSPWQADGELVDIDPFDGQSKAGALKTELMIAESGDTVIQATQTNTVFSLLDPQTLRERREFKLDRGLATAWTLSHDERQLAIGTDSGAVVLWNLQSGDSTWLQKGTSGQTMQLQFSPRDSRLLVSVKDPDQVVVFDVAKGQAVATPIPMAQAAWTTAGFSGENQIWLQVAYRHAAIWQLPDSGVPPLAPIESVPLWPGASMDIAMSADQSDRLVVTQQNRRIRFWRLPLPATMSRITAPMAADGFSFDGHFLAGVDGNRVQVFDTNNEKIAGSTITLQQAPTFADLTPDARSVVTIDGRRLNCWNWRTGEPRWPMVELPDSPAHVAFARNRAVTAVSSGANVDGQYVETVRSFDLDTGRLLAPPLALGGPLETLRFSDDGTTLLAWKDYQTQDSDSNRLHIIDVDRGTIRRDLDLVDDGRPLPSIGDALVDTDRTLWTLSTLRWNDVDTFNGYQGFVRHWSGDGRLLSIAKATWDSALLRLPPHDGVLMIDRTDYRPIASDGSMQQAVPRPRKDETNVGAISSDGKLLAIASLHGVSLIDLGNNTPLLPDLKLPIAYDDAVGQLVFSDDGSRLLARTLKGRQLSWRVARDTRDVDAIVEDLRERYVAQAGNDDMPVDAARRRSLRANDPGPTHEETSMTVGDAGPIPPKPDPRFLPLDLTSIANVDPRALMNNMAPAPPQPQSLPTLPRGLQRYDGIDFLLGGAVQVSGRPATTMGESFPAASNALAVPAVHVAAVDLLAFQFTPLTDRSGELHLRYADGHERTLPILAGHDTLPHWNDAKADADHPRIGWLGVFAQQLDNYFTGNSLQRPMARSYVVHLVNPEPEQAVVSVTLGAPPQAQPGLLYLAVTLERGGNVADR